MKCRTNLETVKGNKKKATSLENIEKQQNH